MASSGLDPPRASYLGVDGNSSQASPADSMTVLPKSEQTEEQSTKKSWKKRPVVWLIVLAALVVVILAVVLPVYFTVIKDNNSSSSSSSQDTTGGDSTGTGNGDGSGDGNDPDDTDTSAPISGGDGSRITLEDGSSFVYENKFGGFWVSDPSDPFNDGAKPNSWTPALNETWTWGTDRAFGVNLGGWFVLEPFISPALYERYPGAVDEWTLSQLMPAEELEEHYATFITEKDFAEIAGAGLNYIRLPIPFWAVDKLDEEPFLERTCWKYILKAFGWARKYGLRINLDLHTIPGSQNGYNHSGKGGQINFLHGTMGLANAQRTLNYIRIITQFISQPEYANVVGIFGFINEALLYDIGRPVLTSWYKEVHDTVREITGVGSGKGPYLSVHDGFEGIMTEWDGFLAGSDRIMLDRHPYTSFSGSTFDDPIATGTGPEAGGVWVAAACAWGDETTRLSSTFGVTYAGEWSNGWNDCGYFLKGIPGSQTFGGDCGVWQDASTWDESVKAGLLAFNSAQMDAFKDFFFWTWKIGEKLDGTVGSPLWSYKLGLENGWILKDPREAIGKCQGLAGFEGEYQPWMTGGAGAGTITGSFDPYPPMTLAGAIVPAAELPVYTPTGTINTLPGPDVTGFEIDGWFKADDTVLAPTAIAGCVYPDPWDANAAAVPTGCGGSGAAAGADVVARWAAPTNA